jgi:uncharacterized membrane protein YebE (DUF533 family)
MKYATMAAFIAIGLIAGLAYAGYKDARTPATA